MRNWEDQFREWARPPGKTEEDRCENAIRAIKNAIDASSKLNQRNISVLVQGSYKNNTNVKKDSDVDVAIVSNDTFFHDTLPEGLTEESLGIINSTYQYIQFKNDIEDALKRYFGGDSIKRGNKAINIHENNYHVEADVAPFFKHRRYNLDGSYHSGVEMRTDNGAIRIINWPEQHYSNGCAKNNSTGSRYKSVVRDLKALASEMADNNILNGGLPGFLIECLVWNVPDDNFQNDYLLSDLKNAIFYIYDNTKLELSCREWGEVSELKYLFRGLNKWTYKQVNDFTVAAWNYAEMGR